VKDLISERSERQQEVIAETSAKWGERIYFYGPILKIPYKTYTESFTVNEKTKETVKNRIAETHYAYFFPDELNSKTVVTMSTPLQRGLYKSNVFSAEMAFDGVYSKPNFAINNVADEDVIWDKATVIVRTTDMKSIKSQPTL